MKFWKKNREQIIITSLVLLFAIAAFEILVYFFLIYKPASRIFGQSGSYPLEIPAVSQILKPTQITNSGISLTDTQKIFYKNKLTDFESLLNDKLANSNQFIKDANVSYIIGGNFVSMDKNTDGLVNITLKNSAGVNINEVFSKEELSKFQISLISLSPSNPGRSIITFDEVKTDDYVIIKKTLNLLTTDPSINNEVEIFRVAK